MKNKAMDKEQLKDLVLGEWRKGYIVYRTIAGLHKQRLDDFTKQPVEGQLYDINRDMATCLAFIDEPMGVNNFASMVLIRHYYDKCRELEEKIVMGDVKASTTVSQEIAQELVKKISKQ